MDFFGRGGHGSWRDEENWREDDEEDWDEDDEEPMPMLGMNGHGTWRPEFQPGYDEDDEDDEAMPMLGMNGHGQWKEEYQHGPKVRSTEDARMKIIAGMPVKDSVAEKLLPYLMPDGPEEEEFGGRFHKKGRHGKHGKGGKHGKKGKHGHGKGGHGGHCCPFAFFLVGLIGTHFIFLKALKYHQMKFEKMTGKEPKGWGCGWRNRCGKKKNTVQQQAQQPVQTIPVQPVAFQQVIVSEPTVEYSFHDADSTHQIIEERDKVDTGVVFAPTTIETNRHQMV